MFSYPICRPFRHKILSRYFGIFSTMCKKSESKKNTSTIRAIKSLNRENKLLFGALLDRPRSKCREPKNLLNITSAKASQDGIQSEALKHSPRINSDILKGSNAKLDETASSEAEISKKKFIACEKMKQPKKKVVKHLPDSKLTNTVKTLPFSLPDIIVRNIKSFPLFNDQKIDGVPFLCDRVLNLSRHDTEFIEYPSVTRILNASMSDASKAALAAWKQKKIEELGEQGFEEYHQNLLLHGSQFHKTIESHLSGKADLEVWPEIQGCWNSLSSVVSDISNVKVLESHVVHPVLMYRGVIDCIADYKGNTVIIDWKKSDSQKPALWNTYDAPIQVAAYFGAVNYDRDYNLKLCKVSGLVVVAYTDGSPSHAFGLNRYHLRRYWALWLSRLKLYWEQHNRFIAIQQRTQVQVTRASRRRT